MWSLAVPFNIPDGWVWVHPTDIGFFGSGKTPAPDQLSKFGTIPYFKVADMNATGNEVYLCHSNSFLKLPNSMKLFSKGAVVYPKNGGAVFTNKKRILGQDSLVDLNTGSYTPFSQMDEKFFYYLFSTVDFQKYYKGTALPTVDMDAVQEIVWALPPLAEQKRIVTAIELTLPLIDKYEETHSQLSRLQHSFPEALKKSILQEAVQGKLVPQDPSDEPAEALLERIRTEKQRLIKEGKIKKDKHESVIFRRDNSHYEKLDGVERCIDDELPFELPKSWCWVRFETALVNRDAKRIPLSVAQRKKLEKKYDYYGASGVIDKVDRYLFDKPLLLIGEDGANLLLRSKPIAFIATGKYWVNNHAHVIDAVGGVDLHYIALFINATNLAPYVTGTAQPKMNQERLNSILVPLPPSAEQHRIVTAFEEIAAIIQQF